MADEEQVEEGAEDKGKKGGAGVVVGIILPALLAGAASFGGAMLGSGSNETAAAEEEGLSEAPGPTVRLQPFVLTLVDANDEPHAMKVTVAIELTKDAVEEDFENFVPRIRDATISMLRSLRFEDASSGDTQAQLRDRLLERVHELGAKQAQAIWVTDFVMQ